MYSGVFRQDLGTAKYVLRGESMIKKEMIAMLLAGGQGSRLGVLTAKVAKPDGNKLKSIPPVVLENIADFSRKQRKAEGAYNKEACHEKYGTQDFALQSKEHRPANRYAHSGQNAGNKGLKILFHFSCFI